MPPDSPSGSRLWRLRAPPTYITLAMALLSFTHIWETQGQQIHEMSEQISAPVLVVNMIFFLIGLDLADDNFVL